MSILTVGFTLAIVACRDGLAPTMDALRRSISSDSTSTVVVTPDAMHGWRFNDDQHDTPCTTSAACRIVQGPAGAPAGSGSAELATTTTTDGVALVLPGYGGTRFDQITTLSYSTFRQSADAGNNLAIALQFNVDYDLTDASTGYQGRLVFEPYQGVGGNVPASTWQSWDARTGKWWGTKASVTQGGVLRSNPCVQATPCTWAQLLAAFPNVGVHVAYGAVVLKAGSGWTGFRGNVDQLAIGVNGVTTTFDFEQVDSSLVPASALDSVPTAIWDTVIAPENILSDPPSVSGHVLRHLIYVQFFPAVTQSQRAVAIASIHARVIGGVGFGGPENFYAILIPYQLAAGDSSSGPLLRAQAAMVNLSIVDQVMLAYMDEMVPKYRRPDDVDSARH